MSNTRRMVLGALLTAMVAVATMAFQVPIPATKGYINLGDTVIFIAALLLGPGYGALAGGVGSAMADLISALEETGELGKGATASYRATVTDKRKHAQAMERDKARYDSYLQRSGARAESGAKLGEGAKAKIKVLSRRLAEAYEELEYASTPEERAEWQDKIDRYSAEIDAIESGAVGGRARPAQAPQIDIQAFAKQVKEEVVKRYGNSPRAREEYERLMRMSMLLRIGHQHLDVGIRQGGR